MPNLLTRTRTRLRTRTRTGPDGDPAARTGTLPPSAAGPESPKADVIESAGVRWLNLEKPREAGREWLEREFGFHRLAIEDVASRNQRPKEVVEALEDSNESVLSHRLNESIRVLTAFSVALLLLTLIASIGGMNVDLPGDSSIHEFWFIIGSMAIVLVAILLVFRRRGYC